MKGINVTVVQDAIAAEHGAGGGMGDGAGHRVLDARCTHG